jgi:hypothetical protein
MTPEEVTQRLFTDFVSVNLDRWKKKGTQAQAEETVVELFRKGVPKSSVTFCFSYLAVSLAHATYYIYRTEPARGSVQVNWNGHRFTVKPAVPSKELAEAILRTDAKFPELKARVQEFLDRMAAELKAEEIMAIAVGAQLEAVIPALGIGCTFHVTDDKVHMDLTRTFKGSVDLPIAELQAFLADPARILGTLHPDGNGYVDDSGHAYLDPDSQFLF